jgi:hypothetical protein
LLAQACVGGESTAAGGYAQTWDELARRLSVSRESIKNWRNREKAGELPRSLPIPRADGHHDFAAWADCMVRYQLARADKDVDPDVWTRGDDEGLRTVTDWKKEREQIMCTQFERSIAKGDGVLLVAADLEVPLGATFAAIQTKLSQFPSRVARYVKGLRDEQEVEDRLRDKIDADLRDLQSGGFIETSGASVLAYLQFDADSERLVQLVTFQG